MSEKEYLLFIPNGNVKPLHEKIRELGGFYNGLGFIVPMKSEGILKTLAANLPKAQVHIFPLGSGQSFAALQQSYRAAYFQDKLFAIDKKILIFKAKHELAEISEEDVAYPLLSDAEKGEISELFQEKERTQCSLEWALGMEKALSVSVESGRSFALKFVSEISPDYFTVSPLEKPVLLEFVKDGDMEARKIPFLHKEIVAMLVAEGGRGKTHICAMLAACVATGVPFLGKFNIKQSGAVCLILGENNQGDIHRLLWKTRGHIEKILKNNEKAIDAKKFCVYQNSIQRMENLLCPASVHGLDASLVNDKGTPTPFFDSLLKDLKDKEPEGGWQLIILDPASRFAGTESEKSNAIATAFIASLERISDSLRGKPTILLSHHKSKAGIRDSSGQADARGASAFSDSSRWQANLAKDKDDDAITIFELTKTNFTPPIQKFKIAKNEYGIPEFGGWQESKKSDKKENDKEASYDRGSGIQKKRK